MSKKDLDQIFKHSKQDPPKKGSEKSKKKAIGTAKNFMINYIKSQAEIEELTDEEFLSILKNPEFNNVIGGKFFVLLQNGSFPALRLRDYLPGGQYGTSKEN